MKTSAWKLLVTAFVLLISLLSCGVVERTMYPNLMFTSTINVERTLRIFGPEDAKIYYGFNKNEPQLWGLIKNGKAELKLDKSSERNEYLSSWQTHSKLINEAMRIFYTNQMNLIDDLVLIVEKDNKTILSEVYPNFWGFKLFSSCHPEEIKKWDIVQSVTSDYNYRGGSKYNQEEIWNIIYRDLVIEINGANH